MTHEDFARFMGEGRAIAGHTATISIGFDVLHILRLDQTTELPLLFDVYEGFESRIEKVVAAIERWATERRAAA
jgi:hypothetical protein